MLNDLKKSYRVLKALRLCVFYSTYLHEIELSPRFYSLNLPSSRYLFQQTDFYLKNRNLLNFLKPSRTRALNEQPIKELFYVAQTKF